MSFIATVIPTLVVGDFAWWWRAHRLLRKRPHARRWQAALAVFFIVEIGGLAVVLASRSSGMIFDALLSRPLLAAIYLWHLLILPLVLIAWLAASLTRGIAALVRWLRREKPAGEVGMSRRDFIGSVAALTPAVVTLGATGASMLQLSHFRIREMELPLAALPSALDGLKIAHVTDIHVGRFTAGAVLDEIVRATNALDADLVLMSGDLINFALRDLPAALDVVHRLRSRFGTFMCVGNHDLIEDGDTFIRDTLAAGVNLLVSDSHVVEIRGTLVQLLGLPWGAPDSRGLHGDEAIAFSTRKLLGQLRGDAFPILLAHHPHAFDYAEKIPLSLAGHTHGGQIMFSEKTGFGPLLFRYWSGLYTKGERALIVSNGVGNWFPLRTHAPAEIIQLTLRAARG